MNNDLITSKDVLQANESEYVRHVAQIFEQKGDRKKVPSHDRE
jgi:hypothetical protein